MKDITDQKNSEETFKNYHRVKKEAEYVLEYDIEGLIIPGGNDVEVRPEIISLIQNLNESDHFPRHNFILDRVVRDGNIITSQGYAFIDFAIEICDWFGYFEDEDDKNGFIKVIKGI